LSNAARDVLAERQRQIDVEGWSREHDDECHVWGELAQAAAAYALNALGGPLAKYLAEKAWPFEPLSFKPKNPRADLVRAAAMIIAQIEVFDRLAEKGLMT
ncbi:MAG TPA: hypothetical protein VE986_06305, partial [Hyphomicrobiales bacterium]|nr:hypothetical protein [Hyphomicrobiales bacterium]